MRQDNSVPHSHRRRKILVEQLRELASSRGAYNVDNFAQNMKKDSAYFEELTGDDRRIGWRLTRDGLELARAIEADTLAKA